MCRNTPSPLSLEEKEEGTTDDASASSLWWNKFVFSATTNTRSDAHISFWHKPRALYAAVFCWNTMTGGRFLAPFLEQHLHVSLPIIGALLAVQTTVLTIGGSLVGPWADRREVQYPGTGRAQCVALGIGLGGAACLLHAWVVPPEDGDTSTAADDDSESSSFSSPIMTSTMLHFLLRILYAASSCAVGPVLDAMTLTYLDEQGRSRDDYGPERLWGAISWALLHFIYGVLLDSRAGFSITYPLIWLVTIGTLIIIYVYTTQQTTNGARQLLRQKSQLEGETDDGPPIASDAADEPISIHHKDPLHQPQSTTSSSSNPPQDEQFWFRVVTILRNFFASVYGITFMICLLILSHGQVVVDSLVFLFFETLSGSYTMMGVTVLLTVAFEIPIFQVAPQLLERTNAGVLLLIACFAYIFRVWGYCLIPVGHIAWVLLLEPLHGVTYACAQMAAVDTGARSSPAGWEATGQGLIAMIKGAGSVVGLLYGGWAEEQLGGRRMYEISSSLVLIGALVFGSVAWKMHKRTSNFHQGDGVDGKAKTGQAYSGVQQEDTFIIDDDDIEGEVSFESNAAEVELT